MEMDTDTETSILVLNDDCIIHILRNMCLEDLVRCSAASTRFLNAAKIVAKSKHKKLIIHEQEDIPDSIYTTLEFVDLFENVVEELELYPRTKFWEMSMRLLISKCTELKTIRFIGFPVPDRVPDPFTQSNILRIEDAWSAYRARLKLNSDFITVSFIVKEHRQVQYAYHFLQNFHNIRNLNFFKEDHYEYPITRGIQFFLTWLTTNRVINSIWLPDQFSYNLERIGEHVHTIRIFVDQFNLKERKHNKESFENVNERLSNLASLKNLTKIRIESYYVNKGTAQEAKEHLTQFGQKHGHQLKELHWCCDFAVSGLLDILNLFTNLEKLIIVNYSDWFAPEIYVDLEDKLPWPAHLTKLKCINFKIKEETFNALVGRESLLELDIYCCILKDMDDDIGRQRQHDFQTLTILLDYKRAKQIGSDRRDQKHLETTRRSVQLLNVYYTKFDVDAGLNIYIEFIGITEPRYWHNLDRDLAPRALGNITPQP